MSGRRLGSLWLAILAAALLPLRRAGAQCAAGNPATCTVAVQLNVNYIVKLTLNSTSTALGNPTLADFNTGFKTSTGPAVTVKANGAWHVTVASAAGPGPGCTTVGTGFKYTGSFSDPAKPGSDLQWGTNGSTYPNNVASLASITGSAGNPSAQSFSMFYKTLWSIAGSPPGNYCINVGVTLSAP